MPQNLTAFGTELREDRPVVDAPPIEIFLEQFPPAIRDTALELRALIRSAVPDAVEGIRSGWRWIGYSLPDGRRVRTFAWIGPERKHIHLGFENGVLLADPDRMLHGVEERLRQFRYFTFEPVIDVDEAILIDFLRRAADVALLPAVARRAMRDEAAITIEPEPTVERTRALDHPRPTTVSSTR